MTVKKYLMLSLLFFVVSLSVPKSVRADDVWIDYIVKESCSGNTFLVAMDWDDDNFVANKNWYLKLENVERANYRFERVNLSPANIASRPTVTRITINKPDVILQSIENIVAILKEDKQWDYDPFMGTYVFFNPDCGEEKWGRIWTRSPDDGIITSVGIELFNGYYTNGDPMDYHFRITSPLGTSVSSSFTYDPTHYWPSIPFDGSSFPECSLINFELEPITGRGRELQPTPGEWFSASFCNGEVAVCGTGCQTVIDDGSDPGGPTTPTPTVSSVSSYAVPEEYSIARLRQAVGNIHKYLIAIGVVASVFLLPYAAILMASGNPESIKKGREWIISLATGLILLIFSGTIIRIIGSELLSFGP